MLIYKTRQFDKWAFKEGLTDQVLKTAITEIENGLIDADLGGHVFKKRVALPGRSKSNGARTLLAYQQGDRAFFIYGFAKNERDNIDDKELQNLKKLAAIQLGLTPEQLGYALREGKLIEVNHEPTAEDVT
ncbi:MAG: type II toxin-antitoxin system RelE/ParE family toxin [Candidatus Competibacteraceae bacterium]|jgi:hypothetical protein